MSEPMIQPSVNPEPSQQVQMVNPQPKKPCCKNIIWFGIGVIITAMIAGRLFMYLQPKTPSAELTTTSTCTNDTDCIFGFQTSQCCACPQAVSQKQIGKNGWQVYEKGKDYSSLKPTSCGNVDCAPCLPPQKATCRNNQCVMERFSVDEEMDSMQTYKSPYGLQISCFYDWSIRTSDWTELGYSTNTLDPNDEAILRYLDPIQGHGGGVGPDGIFINIKKPQQITSNISLREWVTNYIREKLSKEGSIRFNTINIDNISSLDVVIDNIEGRHIFIPYKNLIYEIIIIERFRGYKLEDYNASVNYILSTIKFTE